MRATSRVLALLRSARKAIPPGRNLNVHPDDSFLVSYPKSGNTWVRMLIANLIHPKEPVTLLAAEQLVPDVHTNSVKFFQQMPCPRVIKSHLPFHQTYKRVIYIVRDPRDVAVSQYHFQIKRRVIDDSLSLDAFVSRFVAGTTCDYGSWGEHVGSWLGARAMNSSFLLIRYEDLLRDTESELGRMARFLGLVASREHLAMAVERSTVKRMRELEKLEGSEWSLTKGTRSDISFIRSAKDGQWCSSLSPVSVQKIEMAWSGLMHQFGYTPAFVRARKSPFDNQTNVAMLGALRSATFPAAGAEAV